MVGEGCFVGGVGNFFPWVTGSRLRLLFWSFRGDFMRRHGHSAHRKKNVCLHYPEVRFKESVAPNRSCLHCALLGGYLDYLTPTLIIGQIWTVAALAPAGDVHGQLRGWKCYYRLSHVLGRVCFF